MKALVVSPLWSPCYFCASHVELKAFLDETGSRISSERTFFMVRLGFFVFSHKIDCPPLEFAQTYWPWYFLLNFVCLLFLHNSLKNSLWLPLIKWCQVLVWLKHVGNVKWQPISLHPSCFHRYLLGSDVVKKNRCLLHCLEFHNSHGPSVCNWPDVINTLLIRSVKSNIWIIWYCRNFSSVKTVLDFRIPAT